MSKVDTSEIIRALEAGQNILTVLNTLPVQELDDSIKKKIHSAALSCQMLQLRIFNSRSSELYKVWEGLPVLEYMFGKFIKHYIDIEQLGCTICKDMFPCTQYALREHVESGMHTRKYSNIVVSDINNYWRDESIMLKYGRFVDFDGPNGKIFCKVCCIEIEKDKLEILKHFKENRHQELFKNIVFDITGSKCENESGDFLFSSSSGKNQTKAGSSSLSSSSIRTESSTYPDIRPASTKKSFTRKLVDARLNKNVQTSGVEQSTNVAASDTKSTPIRPNVTAQIPEPRYQQIPKRILFDNIRNMSEVHRMHFMLCSIEDTNLIIPVGLEGVPSHISNNEIERACDFLGEVVRVERQSKMENVIIYIVLSSQYKNVFGKGLEVQIGWKKYKILNPFLYS